MHLITRQMLADSAPSRFLSQYGNRTDANHQGVKFSVISLALDFLPTPIDPNEVDRIIGNTSWTSVPNCDECGAQELSAVIAIGQESDYDSNTAYICHTCLTSAALMLGSAKLDGDA